MSLVTVNVRECAINSQEYGSTNEHMVSRVFFSIDVDGISEGEYHSDIKQTVGSEYSPKNLEVSRPHGYTGPYDHTAFTDEIAKCFSRLVNHTNAMFSLGNSTNTVIENAAIEYAYQFEFEAEGPGASW